MVYKCSHSGELRTVWRKVHGSSRVSMYTAIAQTRNINIKGSSLLLEQNKHGEDIL